MDKKIYTRPTVEVLKLALTNNLCDVISGSGDISALQLDNTNKAW